MGHRDVQDRTHVPDFPRVVGEQALFGNFDLCAAEHRVFWDGLNIAVMGELEKIRHGNSVVIYHRVVSEQDAASGLDKSVSLCFRSSSQVLIPIGIPRSEIQHVVFVAAVRVFQVSVRVGVEIGN